MTLYALGATTVAAYRLHTGDATSAASAVSAALVEAEQLLEEELRRKLPLEARTDSFAIYPDGRIYPDAYPITVSTQTIDGRSLVGAFPDGGPFVGIFPWESVIPARATVTWTGGFTVGTLPLTLAHYIYDLAHGLIFATSASLPAVLVGATSASVGDVSVSYGSSSSGGVNAVLPGSSGRVARYKNRFVG